MEQAVNATLLHVSSTDEDPKHHLCPDGEESWCFFKKGQAKVESPKHDKDSMKTVLAPDVAKELEPVYKQRPPLTNLASLSED